MPFLVSVNGRGIHLLTRATGTDDSLMMTDTILAIACRLDYVHRHISILKPFREPSLIEALVLIFITPQLRHDRAREGLVLYRKGRH